MSLLKDPDPMTHRELGSGMLCFENDDPTAETLCGLFVGAGIEVGDITPWNAYPWFQA